MIENLIASKVKKDEEIFYTESLIRCEKANNWKEEKDDCKTNWKNYPKK
jgi:predicted Zn-dependent protease